VIPLGILAAAGGAVAAADSYDLLATEILTSSQSSVTFASLGTYAADYDHLQIRVVGRSDRVTSAGENLGIRLNSDSGANYVTHFMEGRGSSVSSGAATSVNEMRARNLPTASNTSNAFGAFIIDLLDFSSAKNKTLRTLGGSTSPDFIALTSGLWLDTSAVTSIEVRTQLGNNLITGSRVSLYGIRKAA